MDHDFSIGDLVKFSGCYTVLDPDGQTRIEMDSHFKQGIILEILDEYICVYSSNLCYTIPIHGLGESVEVLTVEQ